MENQNSIAYFIDFSLHEIPSIAPIARETGGIVYTDSEKTRNAMKENHPLLSVRYFKKIDEIRDDIRRSNIRVIVYPDYHIRYFRDLDCIKHVQVFHGTSDKAYDFSRQVLEYDLFFIPGHEAYERYRKKGLLKKGTGVLIGYPKLDRVFRGELERDRELKKLHLDPGKKSVLYAPTWADRAMNSSWKKFCKAFTLSIPQTINLIVKPHPNIVRYKMNEVEELRNALERYENARLLESAPDIIPLMAASDLLIGDVSAVTREFLAFRRPFVFLSRKPVWMWRRRKTRLWECGEVLTHPKKLWPAVMRALEDPEKHLERIEKHLHATFYRPDGKAAQRASEAIKSLIT